MFNTLKSNRVLSSTQAKGKNTNKVNKVSSIIATSSAIQIYKSFRFSVLVNRKFSLVSLQGKEFALTFSARANYRNEFSSN